MYSLELVMLQQLVNLVKINSSLALEHLPLRPLQLHPNCQVLCGLLLRVFICYALKKGTLHPGFRLKYISCFHGPPSLLLNSSFRPRIEVSKWLRHLRSCVFFHDCIFYFMNFWHLILRIASKSPNTSSWLFQFPSYFLFLNYGATKSTDICLDSNFY